MKTVEEIAKELEKLTALDQGGTLQGFAAIGAPFASQALAWVLRDNAKPASELLAEANETGL